MNNLAKKAIFGIGFVTFGTYTLIYPKIIDRNLTLGFLIFIILYSVIPLIYLKFGYLGKRFLQRGYLTVSLFLIISTVFITFNTIDRAQNITYLDDLDYAKSFAKKFVATEELVKYNLFVILVIWVLAAIITTIFNLFDIKKEKNELFIVISHSIGVYVTQFLIVILLAIIIYFRHH